MTKPTPPSLFIVNALKHYAAKQGRALDLACGAGRHSQLLAQHGLDTLAVDINDNALPIDLANQPRITFQNLDLEQSHWPLTGQVFDVVVVCNYLHRPHLSNIAALLARHALVIYETFMQAHPSRYGKPSNPDYLLASQELIHWANKHALQILSYQEWDNRTAIKQQICARRLA